MSSVRDRNIDSSILFSDTLDYRTQTISLFSLLTFPPQLSRWLQLAAAWVCKHTGVASRIHNSQRNRQLKGIGALRNLQQVKEINCWEKLAVLDTDFN